MDERFIARIYVWNQQAELFVGTGYPLQAGVLLTALHVVKIDAQDADKGILVKWPYCDQPDEKLTLDRVHACASGHDIALLHCLTPLADVRFYPKLAQRFPKPDDAYQCRGFPLAGQDDDGHDALPVPGKVVGGCETAQLELLATTPIKVEEDWAGLSGAPVFINDCLSAVITIKYSTVEQFLYAVSIPYLLAHIPTFRKAVGFDNQLACEQFIAVQKDQIKAQLKDMQSGSLCQELVKRLDVKIADHLAERLLLAFGQDSLGVLDTLLKASIEALKHDSDKHAEASRIRGLFFLFVSLMAPHSVLAREIVMSLSVRTRMATELYLAPAYDINPAFDLDKDGLPKGCWAEDASVFTRETGWDIAKQVDEAIKIIDTQVRKKPRSKPLDEFECEELNETLKQRQSREHGKLHRIELDQGDEAMKANPFADSKFCSMLKASNYLPDLPIVYYGKVAAPQEAKLRAKLRELFEILKPYGYVA